MKFFKWKIFIITGIVCLLPILLGVAVWKELPETMAIHFNIYGEPDGFASKGFVVFALPVFMFAVQAFSCYLTDFQSYKNGEMKKIEVVSKWAIPFMTVAVYILTLVVGLGWKVDIRKAVCIIVGVLFLVTGNYLPKADRIKNYKIDKEKARKINRFMGYGTVILGILFIVSCLLPPMYSVACLFLLIPYLVISVVYAIIVMRKK